MTKECEKVSDRETEFWCGCKPEGEMKGRRKIESETDRE